MRLRTALTSTTSIFALSFSCGLLLPMSAANAQSSATLEIEEIIVSSRVVSENIGGLITQEQLAKSRSTVTAEYLETQ